MVDDPVERLSGGTRALFSRMRSKTTIVVVDREPDDGEHRGHEQGVDLEAGERPEDGEGADHDQDVVKMYSAR